MKNLVSKLTKIMGGLGTVSKSGYNDHHKYAYAMEADILEHVRHQLAASNIFVFSSVVSSTREGNLTTVLMEYTLVDGDSGESMKVSAAGQGSDNQDKGVYKAITGANKYFILKNFMLPTGDDPEKEDSKASAKPVAAKTAALKTAASPSVSTPAKSGGFGPAKKATPAAASNGTAKLNGGAGAWS